MLHFAGDESTATDDDHADRSEPLNLPVHEHDSTASPSPDAGTC